MNLHVGPVVFALGLLVYLVIRAVFQRRVVGTPTAATRSTGADRWLVFLVVFGQVVLPGVYLFSPWLNFANHDAPRFLVVLGAFIWGAGLWLFWRSHADLGNNWSVSLEVRSSHQLITHGVYSVIRHPMYAAFLLFGIAQALLLPNWVAGFSALAAVALLCIVRVPREESMMCEFFGEQYRQYMRRTGGIAPRIGHRGGVA